MITDDRLDELQRRVEFLEEKIGIKKPEPKQPVLEEKFHQVFLKHDVNYNRSRGKLCAVVIKDLAKVAIEAVEEVIDSITRWSVENCHERFKKEIREKLL